jgi:glyoxylase-like metal-dependent hydrolase (beta-lactamase superfamily II)
MTVCRPIDFSIDVTDRTTVIAGRLDRFDDTCNVYVVRSDEGSILIDFGSGAILDDPGLGADGALPPAATFITHHHRDQVQGLARAAEAGIEIWVPPVERDLVGRVDEHWQARPIAVNYDTRQDRFSLLDSVPITGSVTEYRPMRCAGLELLPMPTPGHTIGSVSYLTELDDRRVAFTGDLIYGHGKVWSLAATMWEYGELPGVASTILSLLALRDWKPDLILPSHGAPIRDPIAAIDTTVAELRRLIAFRGSHEDFEDWLEKPYLALTPHLLHNRSSQSFSYVLVSERGTALILEFGYDFITGSQGGFDRSARRPWLYTIERLKRDHGVRSVDVVIPTHYHDDHVAGMNLLREVEGTQVWVPDNFAHVMEDPDRFDLPCLWDDPIRVDRRLPVGGTVEWEEYTLGIHALPGHTEFAAAITFDVDGTRVIVTGDQQDMTWGRAPRPERLNHIYPNRVKLGDFVRSAELYARLHPDLMISGHWTPRWIAPDYLEMLAIRGREWDEIHRSLLPLDEIDLGLEGFAARIEPYRSEISRGRQLEIDVWLRNPFPDEDDAVVELVVPRGWQTDPPRHSLRVDGRGEATVTFRLTASGEPVRRARVAADVSIGRRRLGQQAEALVTVH